MEVQIVSSFTPVDHLGHFLQGFLGPDLCPALFLPSSEQPQVFRVAFPDHFLLNMPPSPGRLPSPHPALLFIFCISRYNKNGHFPLAWFCLLTSVSSSERGKGESHCGRKATEPKGGKRKGKAPGWSGRTENMGDSFFVPPLSPPFLQSSGPGHPTLSSGPLSFSLFLFSPTFQPLSLRKER